MKNSQHDAHNHSPDERAEAPAVLNEGVRGERVTILAVNGMDCTDEVKLLNETLGPLDGVRSVEANGLGVCTDEVSGRSERAKKGRTVRCRRRPQAARGRRRERRSTGILAIGDSIRPNAAAAIKALHAAGLEQIVMLNGNNQRTADAIAGTATAIETTDMGAHARRPRASGRSDPPRRRTVRIIQFNIAFALAVKSRLPRPCTARRHEPLACHCKPTPERPCL